MNNTNTPPPSWHMAQWPLLAWAETIIKLAALVIGIVAGVNAFSADLAFPTGLRLAQFVILTILALGLVAGIYDRLQDREIVAMVFVVINNLGHWGMVLGLTAGTERLLLFAALMLLGDLVKIVFIRVHNFTVRDYAPRVLYSLTAFYVVGYTLIILFEWIS